MSDIRYLRSLKQYIEFLKKYVNISSYDRLIEEAKCFDLSLMKGIIEQGYSGTPTFISSNPTDSKNFAHAFPWRFIGTVTGKLYYNSKDGLNFYYLRKLLGNDDKTRDLCEIRTEHINSYRHDSLLLIREQPALAFSLAKANIDTVFGDVVGKKDNEGLWFYESLYDLLVEEYKDSYYEIEFKPEENELYGYNILIYKKDKRFIEAKNR